MNYDLIVIGGGASGMMAAGRAAERGFRVLLIEKNKKLGEKLRISGGGRCNITNAEEDVHVLLKAYGKAEQFLYALFSQFGVKETFSFFESRGLPLVVQARKRAFPNTEKAEDVVKTLIKYLQSGGVTVLTGKGVTGVHHDKYGISGIVCGKETYTATNYLFATGSMSHKETGSTGDGFKWLTRLGHTVKEATPTIVPLGTGEEWGHMLAGVSLSFMKITFFVDEKKALSKTGKILFTHFGISGPLILNLAHTVGDLLHSGHVTALIDAYPHTDLGSLEKTIIKVFDANKNKALKNIIKEFVPEGTHKGISVLLKERLDIEKKVHLEPKKSVKLL
jgi:predicted Rossmann fold flavoprotein